jgi:hypothetical protein
MAPDHLFLQNSPLKQAATLKIDRHQPLRQIEMLAYPAGLTVTNLEET